MLFIQSPQLSNFKQIQVIARLTAIAVFRSHCLDHYEKGCPNCESLFAKSKVSPLPYIDLPCKIEMLAVGYVLFCCPDSIAPTGCISGL